MTFPEFWNNLNHLAITLVSPVNLFFISMVVEMVVVVSMGGWVGFSRCSKRMFLILSVNQHAEIN